MLPFSSRVLLRALSLPRHALKASAGFLPSRRFAVLPRQSFQLRPALLPGSRLCSDTANSGHTAFVGGVGQCSESDLYKFFADNGIEPSGCRVFGSKGFGFADFSSAKDLEAALELNGGDLNGWRLNIDRSHKKEDRFNDDNRAPGKTLVVLSLPYSTTEEALGELFAGSSSLRIVTDWETGDSKGFAFIEFDDVESATAVKDQMDGKNIDGRTISVQYARERGERRESGGFGGRGRGRDGGRGGRGDNFGRDRRDGFSGGRGGGRGRNSSYDFD